MKKRKAYNFADFNADRFSKFFLGRLSSEVRAEDPARRKPLTLYCSAVKLHVVSKHDAIEWR